MPKEDRYESNSVLVVSPKRGQRRGMLDVATRNDMKATNMGTFNEDQKNLMIPHLS